MARRVLIVDDNEDIFKSLRINFDEYGFETCWSGDGAGARDAVGALNPDIILLDLSLGNENGIDVLADLQRLRPGLPVVIITGYGTFETAVQAMKMGAFDFLAKPLDFDRLLAIVKNALRLSSLTDVPGDTDFLTASPQVISLCRRARKLAATSIPILITGESGTGKEVLAEYIHAHSPRRDKPFVRVNCSAFTDTLANSELFGHEKGAFTGAVERHIGYFEEADGGTLHLDEIGDMALAHQARILRVLEEAKLRRIGGTRDIPVDVRVVASTNRKMEDLIEAGAFRQDLLYRLNAVLLYLPPLRERPGDITLLARHFLQEFSDGQPKTFSPAAWDLLSRHDWPGNARELRNLVKVCAVVSDSHIIDVADLPAGFGRPATRSGRLNDIEREAIVQALAEANGNKSLAAVRLGVTRRTLYKKLERYDIV